MKTRSPGDPLFKEGIPVPDPITINSANVFTSQKTTRLEPLYTCGSGGGETYYVHPHLNPPPSRGREVLSFLSVGDKINHTEFYIRLP